MIYLNSILNVIKIHWGILNSKSLFWLMMLRTNGWLHAVFSFYPKDFAEIIVKEEKRHKTLRTMIKGEETAGAKVLPHILENGSRWTEEW